MFLAKINVTLKESVLDPQGQTVLRALHSMGYPSVQDVRVGKYIEIKLEEANFNDAESLVKHFCEKLLVNSVIETYTYQVESL